MKNKLLIGLIIFLVVGIIAVAGALVYVNKNNSNSNTTNIQSSTSINEPGESVQNTEVQSQSVISENKTFRYFIPRYSRYARTNFN